MVISRRVKVSICLFVTVLVAYLTIWNPASYSFAEKEVIWKIGTLWDCGTAAVFFFVYMMGLLVAVVLDRYKQFQQGFDGLCTVRIGLRKYLALNIRKIFSESFLYTLALQVLLLVMVCVFFYNPPIEDAQLPYLCFSDNPMINYPIFVIFSALGAGLFSVFMYSLSLIIKNTYLYIILPILIVFVGLMCGIMLSELFKICFAGNQQLIWILNAVFKGFSPATLLAPGCSGMTYPLIGLFSSICIYFILAVVCFIYTERKKNNEG